MKPFFIRLTFVVAIHLISFTAVSEETVSAAAEVVYTNGKIYTVNPEQAWAEALAIKDGKLLAVGSNSYVNTVTDDKTYIFDLDGAFVMPGFIDNHVHFFEGGAALTSVDLRDVDSREIFSKRIAEYASILPPGGWVLNGNWDHELWGGELPSRHWIDSKTKNSPVFVTRLDGHMALANTAALRIAGINAASVAPEGGEIVFDESGVPTGILKGTALNLILSVIPPPSEAEILDTFESAQTHALSLGLVQVHAVTANETERTMLDAFRLAERRGSMKIRAYVSTPIEHWKSTRDLVQREGSGSDMLRWGGIKGFVDGSLGATTAWFYEPYLDAPGVSGKPLMDPKTLKNLMSAADSAGLRVSVHAIGDRAIDTLISDLLDIAGEGIASKRYRIEHFQHPSQRGIEAAASAGIIASMQPYHAIDDGRWAEERIDKDRIRTTYAFRSILDAGGKLTFGSDWPVAPLSPLHGVYAAVTRRTTDGRHPDGWQPQQKITVEEALYAYTAANAYANFEDDIAGTLEQGKRADFVVLSQDPTAIDPEDVRLIEVITTVIGGDVVFTKHL